MVPILSVFQCESVDDDRIADSDLILMPLESELVEIPEQHCTVCARLSSASFQRYTMTLKELGETMQVKTIRACVIDETSK